ncbi:hypothetical protein K432DRAFT_392157 [Lepidopterella palustris CBS 459.81]|uniref:Rhodopsin domain-containing protein n=1 Tax=Lepidopterella palustris CBS 459.81 TaxID=1314670 RepID=A0A8E2ED09_9PEZI|nr:hypothetical protein K432DRAFT_392157 [Lepidopterella palustris CBS 459.81]
MVVETILALSFLSLRFWARLRLLGGLRSDDYLLLGALLSLVTVTALGIAAALEGFGRHSHDLTPSQNVKATRLIIISQTFLAVCIVFSKTAVADFLLKIVVERWHKNVLWFCIVSTTILGTSVFLGFYTQCTPLESVWNPSVTGKCHMNMTVLGTINADFVLAALPWYFLRNLQMKPKEKIIINLSLSVGVFAGVCGIIRVTKAVALSAKSDYTYKLHIFSRQNSTLDENISLQLWSTTETTVSIMCLCVPTFRPLWRRFVKGLSRDDSGGPFSKSDQGYPLSGRTHTSVGAGNNTFVTAGGGIKHSQKPDNESTDSILRDEDRPSGRLGGIKETKSVVVEYDDRDTTRSQSERSV